jgi:hypothetical protein
MLFFWITDRDVVLDSFWTGKYGMRVTVKKNSEPFQTRRTANSGLLRTLGAKVARVRVCCRVPQKSANSAPHQLQRLL